MLPGASLDRLTSGGNVAGCTAHRRESGWERATHSLERYPRPLPCRPLPVSAGRVDDEDAGWLEARHSTIRASWIRTRAVLCRGRPGPIPAPSMLQKRRVEVRDRRLVGWGLLALGGEHRRSRSRGSGASLPATALCCSSSSSKCSLPGPAKASRAGVSGCFLPWRELCARVWSCSCRRTSASLRSIRAWPST